MNAENELVQTDNGRIELNDRLFIGIINIRALYAESFEMSFWMAAAQFTQVMPLTGITVFLVSMKIYYHKVGWDKVRRTKARGK